MSKYGVTQEKLAALLKRMQVLGVSENDLTEKFIKGSGSGGQKINKTSSCVYLFHPPSGIEVKCQKTRSQALNRYYARQLLLDELAESVAGEKSERQKSIEKIKRQKRKRSKRAQEKILSDKKMNKLKKIQRKNDFPSDE